jgi:hypothetical protein
VIKVVLRYLKKIWIYTKKYWHIITIGSLAVLLYIVSRKNPESLLNILSVKREQYKKELEALDKSYIHETKERKKAQEEYLKKAELIKKEYGQKIFDLSEERERRVKELLKKGKNDPDNAAKIISELYGIKHVKIKDFDDSSNN